MDTYIEKIKAAKITGINGTIVVTDSKKFDEIKMTQSWLTTYTPKIGDYITRLNNGLFEVIRCREFKHRYEKMKAGKKSKAVAA